MHSLKLYSVCKYYAYQTTAVLPVSSFSGIWQLAYKLQLVNYDIARNYLQNAMLYLLGTSLASHVMIVAIAHIVRPHPDYKMCALQAAMSLLGTNCV